MVVLTLKVSRCVVVVTSLSLSSSLCPECLGPHASRCWKEWMLIVVLNIFWDTMGVVHLGNRAGVYCINIKSLWQVIRNLVWLGLPWFSPLCMWSWMVCNAVVVMFIFLSSCWWLGGLRCSDEMGRLSISRSLARNDNSEIGRYDVYDTIHW